MTDDPEFKPGGDPFGSTGSSGEEPPAPQPVPLPTAPLLPMPKLWIGYILAVITFVGEMIALARHPELFSAADSAKGLNFDVPPLEIFLPAFVARAYWFVCVYRYHKILAAIPRYVHPISPAKAVGFHFIPIFNFYWIFVWPSAIADFVNKRLGARLMRGWVFGVGAIGAAICQLLLDPGFGVALLFVATGYVGGFLSRALSVPDRSLQS